MTTQERIRICLMLEKMERHKELSELLKLKYTLVKKKEGSDGTWE